MKREKLVEWLQSKTTDEFAVIADEVNRERVRRAPPGSMTEKTRLLLADLGSGLSARECAERHGVTRQYCYKLRKKHGL